MAGTTPKLELPYPDPTDLIADGADAIKNLALILENKLPYIKLGQANISVPGNQGTAVAASITTPALQAPMVFAIENTGWIELYFTNQSQTGIQLMARNRGTNQTNVAVNYVVMGWPLGT